MKVYHSAFPDLDQDGVATLHGRKVRLLRAFDGKKADHAVPEYSGGMFLDSGAFTAWNSGKPISLQAYIDYLAKHRGAFEVYASLDVIGDAKGSLRNQRKMERAGLHPMPCYHFGEPEEYLDLYIDEYDYFALGGFVGQKKKSALVWWFGQCWGRIESAGKGTKVHGFGMTDPKLVKMFPWHSIDSTTASRIGRTGSIYVPPWRQLEISADRVAGRSVMSPGKVEAVMGRYRELLPDVEFEWKDIACQTREASQLRVALNAMMLDIDLGSGLKLERPKHKGFSI